MLWAAGAVAATLSAFEGPFPRATGLRLRVAANFGVAVRTPARQPTAPATGSLQRPVRRRSLRPRASPPLPGGEVEAVVCLLCLVCEISIEYLEIISPSSPLFLQRRQR